MLLVIQVICCYYDAYCGDHKYHVHFTPPCSDTPWSVPFDGKNSSLAKSTEQNGSDVAWKYDNDECIVKTVIFDANDLC